MLLEDVVEEVLVSLDKSVGVHLPMLDLLLSVTLDSAKESLHLILLLLPEGGLLLRDLDVELLLHVVDLFLLQGLADQFDFLSIDVIFDREVDDLYASLLFGLSLCFWFNSFFNLLLIAV